MHFTPLLILSIISFTLAAPQSSPQARQLQCGPDRFCNDSECQGANDPPINGKGGRGTCLGGSLKGCGCINVCNPANDSKDCDKNGCAGENIPGLPMGQLGICTAGDFLGCQCKSICGFRPGGCSANGCNPDELNLCKSGSFKGCECDPRK